MYIWFNFIFNKLRLNNCVIHVWLAFKCNLRQYILPCNNDRLKSDYKKKKVKKKMIKKKNFETHQENFFFYLPAKFSNSPGKKKYLKFTVKKNI